MNDQKNNVFSSLLSDIEKFESKDLKKASYKERIVKNSIYFITSNAADFENSIISIDGKRIKKEISNHLVRTKLNSLNVDLSDPFSNRTIFYKKKFILKSLFSGYMTKLKLAGVGIANIFPGLDTILGSISFTSDISSKGIKNAKKIEFIEIFGIKDLKDKLDITPELISHDSTKIMKLNMIIEKIDKDEIINNLDTLLTETSNVNESNIKEVLKKFVNKILPSLGLSLASIADDIVVKVGPLAATISKKALIALSSGALIISIPLSITIYVYFLHKALEKILLKHEEYALLLFEIIHN
jgi:hypothetical protein